MNKLSIVFFLILIAGILFLSCAKKTQPVAGSKQEQGKNSASVGALAPCLIYKTKADYSKQVPVLLSEDKSQIASYPDVSDIRKQGAAVFPTILADGFLLDNRGIGPNVAFLNITYDDYLQYKETPVATELFRMILDIDPLTEMYQCGTRFQHSEMVEALNEMIESGDFSNCKKIK